MQRSDRAAAPHRWESPTRWRSAALLPAMSWRVRASICSRRGAGQQWAQRQRLRMRSADRQRSAALRPGALGSLVHPRPRRRRTSRISATFLVSNSASAWRAAALLWPAEGLAAPPSGAAGMASGCQQERPTGGG